MMTEFRYLRIKIRLLCTAIAASGSVQSTDMPSKVLTAPPTAERGEPE